jgi:stage V sporulation protein D (sporulation-specific penicillin-binding protein)
MYAATINGGYLVTPHVVDKVVATGENAGEVVFEYGTQVVRQVISEDTSAQMREALEFVVSNKTDSNAYIRGYRIGGKSGTSEKLDEYPNEDKYVSSYICFAPADDPEIVLLVMADQPDDSIAYYGSAVAVPAARNILTDVLPYIGEYPEYTAEELAEREITLPVLAGKSVPDAKRTLEELALHPEIIGNGTTVIKQVPDGGTDVPPDSRVLLYTDNTPVQQTTVPDVVGLPLTTANEKFASAGLNYIVTGVSTDQKDARVTSQSVPAGTVVDKYSVVEIEFLILNQSG